MGGSNPFKKKMFHTQEGRGTFLTGPIICKDKSAWLGKGYYFWYDLHDAEQWGKIFKKKTGFYQVYSASIESDLILDTVFDEEHYKFWVKQMERVAKVFRLKAGETVSLEEMNTYLFERGIWSKFDGIMMNDFGQPSWSYYVVKEYPYRKRIQLVAFKLNIIYKFALEFEQRCA